MLHWLLDATVRIDQLGPSHLKTVQLQVMTVVAAPGRRCSRVSSRSPLCTGNVASPCRSWR
jgi:hypothetical protein